MWKNGSVQMVGNPLQIGMVEQLDSALGRADQACVWRGEVTLPILYLQWLCPAAGSREEEQPSPYLEQLCVLRVDLGNTMVDSSLVLIT